MSTSCQNHSHSKCTWTHHRDHVQAFPGQDVFVLKSEIPGSLENWLTQKHRLRCLNLCMVVGLFTISIGYQLIWDFYHCFLLGHMQTSEFKSSLGDKFVFIASWLTKVASLLKEASLTWQSLLCIWLVLGMYITSMYTSYVWYIYTYYHIHIIHI